MSYMIQMHSALDEPLHDGVAEFRETFHYFLLRNLLCDTPHPFTVHYCILLYCESEDIYSRTLFGLRSALRTSVHNHVLGYLHLRTGH